MDNNAFKRLSNKFLLMVLYLKRWGQIYKGKAQYSLKLIYDKSKLVEIFYFFKFLIHQYTPKQFTPLNVPGNLRLLYRVLPDEGLTSTRNGKLMILRGKSQKRLFSLKNFFLLGALQNRVEKVIFYTYLTVTLELNNPFDQKTLQFFLKKKINLLHRLLDYVKKINGKLWDQSAIKLHIEVFERNSLFQAEIIRRMRWAVKKETAIAVIQEAKAALEKGLYPVLVSRGASGSYWMRGTNRQILGLFKPFDEEIHAPHNPVGPKYRGALGLRKTRSGCRVGESPHHEVGAFVVDEFFGFGIVPKTYYAEFSHHVFFSSREDRFAFRKVIKKKYGSFQEFVGGFVSMEKLTHEEIASIPLDEFQLLIVLDVIVGNTDRNAGNILFGDEKIAAIDHGLCFPDTHYELSYWYWAYFRQGDKPLYQPIIDLLNNFPFEELAIKLHKKCFISWESLQAMHERVVLFKEAINAGLVPSELADLFKYEHLHHLKDLKYTLNEAAAEQVKLYKETICK